MKLVFIRPEFAAKVFAISSAITCVCFFVFVRIVLAGLLGIGDKITRAGEMASNFGLGVAMSYALALFTPAFFIAGWVSGYLIAIVANACSSNTIFFLVPIGAFKLEDN